LRLIAMDVLPNNELHTQEYFINGILPRVWDEKKRIAQNINRPIFGSHGHVNGIKVIEENSKAKLKYFPHPSYLSDLNSCDFWFFLMLKYKMKDRLFQTIEAGEGNFECISRDEKLTYHDDSRCTICD
jgi:hypothetical protein